MSDAERLQLLEERYAHLQRHVAEQDKAMLRLGDEIARLQKELATWRALLTARSDPDASSTDERPPHY
jgi:SlyX protein